MGQGYPTDAENNADGDPEKRLVLQGNGLHL
jgi:hypothetical protein